MRTAFIQALTARAKTNRRIFLVVGDLGYSVVEPFAKEFPDRFLNAGVAEQNMTGMAAGLAAEGFHVFTYSIANFPTLRCLEQVRNDICYHNLPVTVVAVGAGLAYGNLGYSHHAVQDIAALRGMPNITIASPADPNETRACLDHLLARPGPSYLRLGKAGEPTLHHAMPHVVRPIQVIDGSASLALCATGSVLCVAIEAATLLQREGVTPAVYSVPLLAPTSAIDLMEIWKHRNVVTIEEHVLAGGFGSLMRELAPDGVRIRSLGVDSQLPGVVGSQVFLRSAHGLTATAMADLSRSLC